jgi:hypothetical protein
MVKKDWVKNINKGDVMTKFWYTLKNLDLNVGLVSNFWNINLVLVYGGWYFDTICIIVSKYFSKLYMNIVATLALGSWPRQGLARLGAKRKPRSEGKCEGMNLHIPKGTSILGVWSLGGLSNIQRAIIGVKTQWIETFFISFET